MTSEEIERLEADNERIRSHMNAGWEQARIYMLEIAKANKGIRRLRVGKQKLTEKLSTKSDQKLAGICEARYTLVNAFTEAKDFEVAAKIRDELKALEKRIKQCP